MKGKIKKASKGTWKSLLEASYRPFLILPLHIPLQKVGVKLGDLVKFCCWGKLVPYFGYGLFRPPRVSIFLSWKKRKGEQN